MSRKTIHLLTVVFICLAQLLPTPVSARQPNRPAEAHMHRYEGAATSAAPQQLPSGSDLVVIKPMLRLDGDLYEVAYRTNGSLRLATPEFFVRLDKVFVESQGISEILVSSNGELVTDPDTIAKVFVLYRGAIICTPSPPASISRRITPTSSLR